MNDTAVYATIKLSPFYQEFLRGHFNNNNIIFKFPAGHDLRLRFEMLLTTCPDNYKGKNFGKHTFRIEVPNMKHKTYWSYNYITKNNNAILITQIKNYCKMIFREKMNELRKAGFQKKECISIIIEELKLNVSHTERLLKDYQRWSQNVCKIAKRQRNKGKKIFNSVSGS